MTENTQQQTELTPEGAKERIGDLMNDRDWQAARFNGDAAKQAEWTRLHGVAYGHEPANAEDAPDVGPAAPTLPGETPVREDGVLQPGDVGHDEASAALFAGPRAPHEYDVTPIYGGKEPSDQDLSEQMSIQAALHAEGVPTFAVSVAVNVIAQSLKNGLPDAAGLERSRSSCIAELQRKHGEGAEQIIADASKVFQRLDARDSRIGDILCNTGAANNPHLVETLARLWREVFSKKSA